MWERKFIPLKNATNPKSITLPRVEQWGIYWTKLFAIFTSCVRFHCFSSGFLFVSLTQLGYTWKMISTSSSRPLPHFQPSFTSLTCSLFLFLSLSHSCSLHLSCTLSDTGISLLPQYFVTVGIMSDTGSVSWSDEWWLNTWQSTNTVTPRPPNLNAF